MYKYPYGDSQQLNLDWIIAKIKELEASGGAGGAGLEEVANALISLTYNTSTAYQRYDYAFLNGKLYRCLSNTSGAFNPTAWQEALIGEDLAVLTRWINAINAAAVVDVKFDTSGTNGKIQQKYNDTYHDVVEVDYTPVQNSKRPLSSNAGYELNGAIKYILTSTGDSSDRSADILAKLNNYGVCYLADGEFYINAGVTMPDNTSIFGMGAGTKVILANNASSQFVFNVGSYCTVSDLTIIGNSTELPYSSYTRGNRKAIQLIGDYSDFNTGTYSHNFAKLSNLTIQDFNHSGIWAYKNDGAASFLATNIDILRCHTGINIELFSEFHSFSNIRCRWCNIACVMQGGNNLFSNCHFDVNLQGIRIDGDSNTLVNDSHSSFSNCTICHPDNNTGYAIWAKKSINGLIITNCEIWYGAIYIDTCSSINISNNIIGGTNNNVTVNNSNKIWFTNNLFKINNPTISITSVANIIWENNQKEDGTLISSIYSRGSVSSASSQIVRVSETLQSLGFEEVGVCRDAGQYICTLHFPWYAIPAPRITLRQVTILGVATIPVADVTISTQSSNYIRLVIPYANATVGDVKLINIVGDLALG